MKRNLLVDKEKLLNDVNTLIDNQNVKKSHVTKIWMGVRQRCVIKKHIYMSEQVLSRLCHYLEFNKDDYILGTAKKTKVKKSIPYVFVDVGELSLALCDYVNKYGISWFKFAKDCNIPTGLTYEIKNKQRNKIKTKYLDKICDLLGQDKKHFITEQPYKNGVIKINTVLLYNDFGEYIKKHDIKFHHVYHELDGYFNYKNPPKKIKKNRFYKICSFIQQDPEKYALTQANPINSGTTN